MHPFVYLLRCNEGIEKSCMPCTDGKRRRFKTHVEDRGVKAAGLLLYFFCFCDIGCFGPWSLSWIPFQVLGKVEDGVLGQATLVELGGILEEWFQN
jgi:hypothetical protein